MFRLTKAHCSLLHFALLGKESKEQENVLLREALYPLLHLLLECLVLPGIFRANYVFVVTTKQK